MKVAVLAAVVCLLATAGSAPAAAADKSSPFPTLIARGKYLVEDAGQCQDCHTLRNQKGEFVREQWLMGAPVDFKPAVPVPVWAEKSANIAGLSGWTDAQAIKFLMTGIAYNDLPARPPMPQYRFSRQDATAMVAYLRSLKTPAATTPAKKSGQ